jgi:hypothetical protein
VREAVSCDLGRAIKIGWGRSNREGGERLRAAPLLSAAVKSPESGRVRATAVPGSPELVRDGEDDSTNSMAGLWPRDRGQRGGNSGEKLRAGRGNFGEEFRPPGEAIGRDRARGSSSGGGGALWANTGALDGVGLAGHSAGAASKRSHTPARPNWLQVGVNRGKQARG